MGEDCVVLLCFFQLLLSLCVSVPHRGSCHPASQLKHENSAAPGLVLRFLATFWGNASLAEFSCSPVTTLLLPHPFCLFFPFLFCSSLHFFADCYILWFIFVNSSICFFSLFIYNWVCFLDLSCWVSSTQHAQPGREQWREVGCCSGWGAGSACVVQRMACILH